VASISFALMTWYSCVGSGKSFAACLAEEVRGLSLLDGVRVEEGFWICL
jgi:hypothetical protein